MPAVSLIVPNYNHARFLRKRIDSIFDVPEILGVVHDLPERFKPQENVLEQVCKMQAERWVPAVMSAHVPL